ncbi:MAG: TerC family protein [Burkholderiales bacterium]|nr:TerC family protein [Burkholderiales bacterium]MDQ3197055.1 TerC family protein [Pseudomonadota bacterium]
MEWLSDPAVWISLATLTTLEIVLGVDNLVFIAILANRLPEAQRARARQMGLGVALATRLLLLFTLTWVIGLTEPIFSVMGRGISWRDVILIAGGLFLLAKSTHEIHGSLEGDEAEHDATRATAGFAAVVLQIGIIDIVFSLDSVITAVGMVDELWIMITAVVLAMVIMLVASAPLAEFVERHPTVKMLALSFLLLIGMSLIADGLGFHIPKGYLYGAMAFSVLVEVLNLLARRKSKSPVKLRTPTPP